jgi:uracil-DNA glycosylase family protein
MLLEKFATAAPLIPKNPTLEKLKRAAADCRACPLWKTGTQTVFGEGSKDARVVFVGEQPGDQEDLAGKPFIGPAGRLLDQVLQEVGIDRKLIYVTNAVKHFKWEPRGKRRLHKKPSAREIAACRPWLEVELSVLNPDVVVALGATASQSLMGNKFKVTRERGMILETTFTKHFMATVHPSAILRAPDEKTRHEQRARFIHDIKKIKPLIK